MEFSQLFGEKKLIGALYLTWIREILSNGKKKKKKNSFSFLF